MKIPKANDFIKHRNSMDSAIRIDKVYTFKNKMKVKGTWWNQGFRTSYPIGFTAKFEIKNSQLKNWFICENPQTKCIRDEQWLPLEK